MRKLAVRIVKYSLVLLAVVVVLLIAAPFFININDYKQTVIDKAEKVVGRQITVGSMHVSLFPWVGVRLDDVHIKNRTGFSMQDFVSVKSLDAKVDLLPLLSKQIVIKRFVLEEPQVQIERNAHGETSWGDLIASRESGAATQAAPAGAGSTETSGAETTKAAGGIVALSARTLRIVNGEFVYRDDVSGTSLVLNQLKLNVDHVQMEQPVQVTVSGMLDGDSFRIDGQVGPIGDLAKLNPSHLPVQMRLQADSITLSKFQSYAPVLAKLGAATVSVDARFEQRPDGVRISAGGMEMAAGHDFGLDWKLEMPSADTIEVQSMKLRLDKKPMGDANGEIKGIGGKLHYQLRAKLDPVSRETVASWLPQVQSMYAGNPNAWKQFSVGLLATGDTSHVELRDVQLMLDNDLLQASGAVAFAGAPDIRLRVTSKALHVDPWLPQPQNGAPATTSVGVVSAPAPAETTASTTTPVVPSPAVPSPAVTTTGSSTSISSGQSGGAGAQVAPAGQANTAPAKEPDLRFLRKWHVNAQMQIDTLYLHGLTLQNLRADMQGNDGRFTLEPLQFGLSGGQVVENASLSVNYYPVRWTESAHITGVQVKPVLQALAGTDMVSGLMRMDTHLQAKGLLPQTTTSSLSGTGKVQVSNGSIKGIDIPGTLRRLTAPTEQGAKSTDFSQLSATFNIDHGVVSNDDLYMASPLFRLTGQGQINLASKTLDYHVKPRLVGSLIGQGDTEAVRRGLVVPLHLTGPLEKPKVTVEVDPATLIQNAQTLKGVIKNLKHPKPGTNPEEQIKKTLKQFLPMFK